MRAGEFLEDPVLIRVGVAHGFGTRGAPAPQSLLRPQQVHGIEVAEPSLGDGLHPVQADAVVCRRPGLPVGIVTADCVPILVANGAGSVVAAIHAGWRGLAAGVIAAALRRLESTGDVAPRMAAIGPHVGQCCYEVDEPVVEPLRARFGDAVHEALVPSRPGHYQLALVQLVTDDLVRAGIGSDRIGAAAAFCTACDSARFESFRRDGAGAGRMVHWIAPRRAA